MLRIAFTVLSLSAIALSGCGGGNTELTPSSRDAFIGKWQGKYAGLDDELIIDKGSGEYEVTITIHAKFDNPDKVNGKVVASDRIEVAEQSMGGAPGTAIITLTDGKIQLKQSGMGMTVEGKDYVKQ